MKKKEIVLIAVTAILAALYVYFFTDWFAPKIIRIQHTIRPNLDLRTGGSATGRATPSITFALDKEWQLTEVKVVPLAEWQTNKYAHLVWHMLADLKPAPTRGFIYGGDIKGMHLAERGIMPDPLQAGIVYRLIVNAGNVQGVADFEVGKSAAR
jgi:hypothetical protein